MPAIHQRELKDLALLYSQHREAEAFLSHTQVADSAEESHLWKKAVQLLMSG